MRIKQMENAGLKEMRKNEEVNKPSQTKDERRFSGRLIIEKEILIVMKFKRRTTDEGQRRCATLWLGED